MLLFRAYFIKYRSKYIYVLAIFLILFGRYLRGDNIFVGRHANLTLGLLWLIGGIATFFLVIQLYELTGLHKKMGYCHHIVAFIIGRSIYINYELGVLRMVLIPATILLVWIYSYILYQLLAERYLRPV